MAEGQGKSIGKCLRCTFRIYKTRSGKYIGHSPTCKNYLTKNLNL